MEQCRVDQGVRTWYKYVRDNLRGVDGNQGFVDECRRYC